MADYRYLLCIALAFTMSVRSTAQALDLEVPEEKYTAIRL